MRTDAGKEGRKEGKKEEREQGSKYAYVYRIWDRPRRTRREGGRGRRRTDRDRKRSHCSQSLFHAASVKSGDKLLLLLGHSLCHSLTHSLAHHKKDPAPPLARAAPSSSHKERKNHTIEFITNGRTEGRMKGQRERRKGNLRQAARFHVSFMLFCILPLLSLCGIQDINL